MGAKSVQCIGKPLPGRESVVVTRDRSFHTGEEEHLHVAHDLEWAWLWLTTSPVSCTQREWRRRRRRTLARRVPQTQFLRLTRVDCNLERRRLFSPTLTGANGGNSAAKSRNADPGPNVDLEYVRDYRRL